MVTAKRSKYRQGFGGGGVELSSLSVGKSREGLEMSQPECPARSPWLVRLSTEHV